MKKILVILMCITMFLCGSVYAVDFSDLSKEHWAYNNVMKMVDKRNN